MPTKSHFNPVTPKSGTSVKKKPYCSFWGLACETGRPCAGNWVQILRSKIQCSHIESTLWTQTYFRSSLLSTRSTTRKKYGRKEEGIVHFQTSVVKTIDIFHCCPRLTSGCFWANCCLRTQGRSVLHKAEFTSTSGNMKTYLSPPSHSAASQLVICLLLQGAKKCAQRDWGH